ncbi:hypothetical protein Tco_0425273 [Tanacetum coccineum]
MEGMKSEVLGCGKNGPPWLRKIPESPWGSPIPIGDGDGDVNRFPDGDGDGDGDEAEKRGWDRVKYNIPEIPEPHSTSL